MLRILTVLALAALLVQPAFALADLSVEGNLILDPSPRGPAGTMSRLGPGQAIFVEGVVINNGNTRSNPCSVELRAGGKVIGRKMVPALRPGRTDAFSIRWVPEGEGTYEVAIIVDPSNQVAENDEANNAKTVPCEVKYSAAPAEGEAADASAEKSDLIVSNVTVYPPPRAGQLSTVTVEVRNVGDVVANEIVTRLLIGDNVLGNRTIESLAPEGKKTINFSWTPGRRGPHVVTAVADPENAIPEKNEENNRSERVVEVIHR